MATVTAKFGFSALKHIDAQNIRKDAILPSVSILYTFYDEVEVTNLLRFDAAKIAADHLLSKRVPPISQRTANLHATSRALKRLATSLDHLSLTQRQHLDRGLRLSSFDSGYDAERLHEMKNAILWLYQDKYRIKRTPFDRALLGCAKIFHTSDDVLDSDLFNGMCLKNTRPRWVSWNRKSDQLSLLLSWLANAALASIPLISKSGRPALPGIHTIIAYLAPRFEHLNGSNRRASYWGFDDDTHDSEFEQFVTSMLQAAELEFSDKQISRAIREYCRARNAVERQETG